MKNRVTAYFLSILSSVKEHARVNSKLLLQIFVLLTVPLNTIRALQVVQAKTTVQTFESASFVNSTNSEVTHASRALSNNRPVDFYPVSIRSGLGNDSDLLAPLPIQPSTDLIFQGPGTVLVPILLYHRIDRSLTDSQYYVSPDEFEEQMKLLWDWGYTTISTELLVKAIEEGTDLPLRPIIITFDDGHLNNYTNAFPVMKKYGFTGTLYIVGKYMGTPEYMNAEQIREMVADGWDVGSHSMSHLDLTSLDPQQQQYEIVESRRFLETELGIPIQTFSYPFGVKDTTVVNLTYSAGYTAAMGTGYTYDQGTSNLFALQRRGVNGTRDLNAFASVLPWQGDAVYLLANLPASSP
ncbi:MAG: polysaccharide deacetylase family protein [Anaerolineales bacterium]|nr:polysaccharide deacetylase family protein [Anaerolineales bacterium]